MSDESPLGNEGCLYPDRCCMPGMHYESECHTAEDLMAQEIDYLKQENERLRFALKKLEIGSCSCLTKTPEVKFHAEHCRYRIIEETLNPPAEGGTP